MKKKIVIGGISGKAVVIITDEERATKLVELIVEQRNKKCGCNLTDLIEFLPPSNIEHLFVDLGRIEAFSVETLTELAVPDKHLRFPN